MSPTTRWKKPRRNRCLILRAFTARSLSSPSSSSKRGRHYFVRVRSKDRAVLHRRECSDSDSYVFHNSPKENSITRRTRQSTCQARQTKRKRVQTRMATGQIHEANIEARTRERGAALSLSAKQDATNVRAKLAPTHSARANSSGGRVLKANGVHQVQDPKEQTELAANLPADSPVMGMRNWGVWRKQCAGRLACDLRPERPGSPWWSYTLGGADGSAIP